MDHGLIKRKLEAEGSNHREDLDEIKAKKKQKQQVRRPRSSTDVRSEVVHLKKALSEKEENEEGLKAEVSFLRERFYSLNDKFVAIKQETSQMTMVSEVPMYSSSTAMRLSQHNGLNTKEFDRINTASSITDAPSCVSISVMPGTSCVSMNDRVRPRFVSDDSGSDSGSGSDYEDDSKEDDDDVVVADDGYCVTGMGM